jgi:murein DD-endopeptidase MepM/ murein hydrolase activator NlpD
MRRLLGVAVLAVVIGMAPGAVSPAQAKPDPRWHFYTHDKTRYTSPWFAGGHRVMVPYGCTRAPYYDPDPRCSHHRGFHHGIDVAMACGTPIYAGRRGRVLSASAPGTPGPAYGVHPFRIRSGGRDILIGHARRVYVDPGDRVRRGQLIARASDSGAPDGCHLHFEVRRKGAGYTGAIDPSAYLMLNPVSRL